MAERQEQMIVDTVDLEALGDSIRTKAGATNKMTVKAMKTAVDGIEDMLQRLVNERGYNMLFAGYNGTNEQISYYLNRLDMSNVRNLFGMFRYSKVTTIPYFDTSKVINMGEMFADCSNLTEIPELDTSNVTGMNKMFVSCSALTTIPQLNTSKVTTMWSMFYSCSKLTEIPELDTSNVTDMQYMFRYCRALTTIPQLNTSNVTNMNSMFDQCKALVTIPQLDTSNVTDMGYMFLSCSALTTIPQLNTSNVTNMNSMFYSCSNLTEIPELDTNNVTNMYTMFSYCSALTTIQQLNIDKVTNISSMFNYCKALTNLKLLNIKINLQVGSGTSWGHLLTVESLIGLCQECINVGSARTLTVGSANLDKIQNSGKFYKFVDSSITEVAVGEKGEIEECESTVTGSFSITDYMAMKNWTLA